MTYRIAHRDIHDITMDITLLATYKMSNMSHVPLQLTCSTVAATAAWRLLLGDPILMLQPPSCSMCTCVYRYRHSGGREPTK